MAKKHIAVRRGDDDVKLLELAEPNSVPGFSHLVYDCLLTLRNWDRQAPDPRNDIVASMKVEATRFNLNMKLPGRRKFLS